MRRFAHLTFVVAALLSLAPATGVSAQDAEGGGLLYIGEYEIAPGRVLGDVTEEAAGWVTALRETGRFESVRLYMHDMGPSLSVYLVMEPHSWSSLRQGFDEFFAARPDLFTSPWEWSGHSDNILTEIPVAGGPADADAMVGRLRYQWQALAVGTLAAALEQGGSPREHGRTLGRMFSSSWGTSLTPEGFARGMGNNLALLDATVEVAESGRDRAVLESSRPWAESWGADYEEWGVSVEEYETWLAGVMAGIGAPHGISVEVDRIGDRLRMTFES